MKKLFFLTLVLFIELSVFGQFTMQVGKNRYPSTRTWHFSGNGFVGSVDTKVVIGKTGTGGCLMLSSNLEKYVQYIRGSITLILEDTALVLTNTIARDLFDGSPTAIYSINSKQYGVLQKKQITEIRFDVYSITLERNQFLVSKNFIWYEIDGLPAFVPKYSTTEEIKEINR